MLRRELVNLTSKEKTYVNFFEDDNIETVREQSAKSANSHPDRMFILVSVKLPKDHYTNDIRNWEALFDRLSYHSSKIEKLLFDEYQTNYRFPNTHVRYEEMTRDEWMSFPESLKPIFSPESTFAEYRTLGVQNDRSYILELSGEGVFAKKIPSAKLPIPEISKLIESLYDMEDVDHFGYQIFKPIHENVSLYYFPRLVPDTPQRMSDESVRLLDKNAKLLEDILKLKVPHEKKVSIFRAKFYVPWVETSLRFLPSVRTRFEQIFYGLTVSEEVPYVGYFTSPDEINRHKFYIKDPKVKQPFMDIKVWKSWWNSTKPQNKQTLLFYRGKCKDSFDRIAVTDEGMSMISHREFNCTDSLDAMKKDFFEFLQKLDALVAFIDPKDIAIDRWETQDLTISLHYSENIKNISLLRFNCISPFFGINRKQDSVFTFLRSDKENFGLSSIQATIIEMMNEGPVDTEKIAKEFSISLKHAGELIKDITTLLEENPAVRNIAMRRFPTLTIFDNYIVVKNITNIKLLSKYTNFLRFILSNPNSKDLDGVCPARSETVEAIKTVVSKISEEDFSMFGDFDDIGLTETEDVNELIEDKAVVDTKDRSISNQRQTKYGYFKEKLQEFDPETFEGKNDYAKKCEYSIQPVPLTPQKQEELKEFMDGEFDYLKSGNESEYMETTSPDAKYICPEYWCSRDEIPLRQNQLLKQGSALVCPVCKRGIYDDSKQLREFPVIERKKEYKYPNLQKEMSKNGRNFPCCYKTSRTKQVKKDDLDLKDKAYVFQSTVRDLKELRFAKLDKKFMDDILHNVSYSSLDNQRLADNKSGFFRVGLGDNIKHITKFLDLKGKEAIIPLPNEVPAIALRCSFLTTWKHLTDTHAPKIYSLLTQIKNEKTRERISKIISGITDAYNNKKLSSLDTLEYVTAACKCQVYLISDNKIICSFGLDYPSKQIVVFKTGESLSILSHVTRHGCRFSFTSNILETEIFGSVISKNLAVNVNAECNREIPSYQDAIDVTAKLFPEETYNIVVDSYQRGVAIYIPKKLVLPFRPSPLPEGTTTRLEGFENITQLPSFTEMLEILKQADTVSRGYEFAESMYDVTGNITEILTKSGLRIPVESFLGEKRDLPGEVIKTVDNEEDLISGQPDSQFKKAYDEISYISEVHEFLLFQLSKDLDSEDYRSIRKEFEETPIKRKSAEKELRKWFNKTLSFTELKDAQAFISKVRAPCGQFSKKECKGNLCGWDGKVCRIQVKNDLKEDQLFGRLFATMFSNSKLRSAVLDGRITPFFGTILYIELPHELIMTDKQIF